MYLALKLAQQQQAERVTEWIQEEGLLPLKSHEIKVSLYRNLRASLDRSKHKEFYNRFGVDPYNHQHEPVQDHISDRLTTTHHSERLEDNTLSLYPDVWKASLEVQAHIIDQVTKGHVRTWDDNVDLIDDPTRRLGSDGYPLQVSRLVVAAEKMENIAAGSREQHSQYQRMYPEAKK